MATAIFIHDGDAIDYRPESDVAAGDVIVMNDLVAVAKRDIPALTLGALAVTGVFEFPKGGEAIAAGVPLYWDPVNKVVVPSLVDESRVVATGAGTAEANGVYVEAAPQGNERWRYEKDEKTRIVDDPDIGGDPFFVWDDAITVGGLDGTTLYYGLANAPDPVHDWAGDYGAGPNPVVTWFEHDFLPIGRSVLAAGDEEGTVLVRLTCHA